MIVLLVRSRDSSQTIDLVEGVVMYHGMSDIHSKDNF